MKGSMIGTEFSGKMKDGRRYMGFARSKCIANVVETKANNAWPVPDQWTLEEAATVPVVYSTVRAIFPQFNWLKIINNQLTQQSSFCPYMYEGGPIST